MTSNELINDFYGISNSLKDLLTTLEALAQAVRSKASSKGLCSLEEQDMLNKEYQTLVLFLHLFKLDKKLEVAEKRSMIAQLFLEIEKNREFKLVWLLMEWAEKTKFVDVYSKGVDLTPGPSSSLQPSASLDPDMVFNTKPDPNFTNALSKTLVECFWLIRCGRLQQAQELLIDSRSDWQALTLGGLLPFFSFSNHEHSERLELPSLMCTTERARALGRPESLDQSEIGNCNVDLYMSTCWVLSQQSKIISERAIYGSLCGNLDSVLEMCEDDIHDYFWALVRCIFVFGIRERIRNIEDPFEIHEVSDEIGMPDTIPVKFPTSLERVLGEVQRRHSERFTDAYIVLQFNSIAMAIKGDWRGLLNNVLNTAEKTFRSELERKNTYRFVVHLYRIVAERFKIKEQNISYRFEKILGNYIRILAENSVKIDVIVYHLRFLSYTDGWNNEMFRILYSRYNTNDAHWRISSTLKTYAAKEYQGILSIVIKEYLKLNVVNTRPETVVNDLNCGQIQDKFVEDIVSYMDPPVTKESLHSVIELIRQLILACELKLAHSLLNKCDESPKDQYQEAELKYWKNFLHTCDSYKDYHSLKSHDPISSMFEESDRIRPIDFISQHKLDTNPVIANEKYKQKCKQLAEQILDTLLPISGLLYYEFPLLSQKTVEIQRFQDIWWHILISWNIEIFHELKDSTSLLNLHEALNSTFTNKLVEDQRAGLIKAVERHLSKLR